MLSNAILSKDFNNPQEMVDWLTSLPGGELSFENSPPVGIVHVESISHTFYPPGMTDSALGILCTVVVKLEEKDA